MTMGTLEANEVLQQPYSWRYTPQPDGTWVGEIKEIPGCYVQANSQEEAATALREHARELVSRWVQKGKRVPPPIDGEFSGHFALRLPKDLHRRAALHASDNGTSLNQFIVSSVGAAVGAYDLHTTLSGSFNRISFQSNTMVLFGLTEGSPPTQGYSAVLNASPGAMQLKFTPDEGR
jgi:predicted HicB family RNase H-like nuclease